MPLPLSSVSGDETCYLAAINRSLHWALRPSWPGRYQSCYLIVLTRSSCTGLCSGVNLSVKPAALCLLTARINHRAHSPRHHQGNTLYFWRTSYLCLVSSLECQSPTGWISLWGSTCLSPPSSVCDAPMDLQTTEMNNEFSRVFTLSAKHEGSMFKYVRVLIDVWERSAVKLQRAW